MALPSPLHDDHDDVIIDDADVPSTSAGPSSAPRLTKRDLANLRKRKNTEARAAVRQQQPKQPRMAASEARGQRDKALIASTDAPFPEAHDLGPMNNTCPRCGSLFFRDERTTLGEYNMCCHKGTIAPMQFGDFPDQLKELFVGADAHFRTNARAYNNNLAVGSFRAHMETLRGPGPFSFRIHGQTYHSVNALHPNGGPRESAQLFIIDTAQAADELAGRRQNRTTRPQMFRLLMDMLKDINPFVRSLLTMHEVELNEEDMARQEGRAPRSVNMTFRVRDCDDQRRYQLPTATEVAVVYVGNEEEIPGRREIIVRQRGGPSKTFRETNRECDPCCYPLFFPTGTYGWHCNIPYTTTKAGGKRAMVSMREFYCNLFHVKTTFSPIFYGEHLLQQYAVDVWTRIEQSRLRFLRLNQERLRIESLSELEDFVDSDQVGGVGSRIILPSSYRGSPRHMVKQYHDAMSIVGRFGKPDYFITMTCNPGWKEIQEHLLPGQTAMDRPDIVARVFEQKLEALSRDLFKRHVFGKTAAYVYTVEFQKRGLPHAHILIIMLPEARPRTVAQIDKIVSAELPDEKTDPELYELVGKFMLHRRCGTPESPCTQSGKCAQRFPKEYSEVTSILDDGFAKCRRPDNGRTYRAGAEVLDNRYVVPYNGWLLRRYQCHLNVEMCGMVGAVKYLYKYIYKGSTRASVHLEQSGRVAVDEINEYLDTRYVCAPEAMHHIFGFKMMDRSVSVDQLPVHLPGRQGVLFRVGDEAAAVEVAREKKTRLTAYFELNCSSPVTYSYAEMPEHFTFSESTGWKRRQRRQPVIGRMVAVFPRDRERYALRLLLLHRTGPTSYEDLRTVNGTLYDTFVEAAMAAGHLGTDDFIRKAMEEAEFHMMPKQFRGLFIVLLTFGVVNDAHQLWTRFLPELSADFARQNKGATWTEASAYFDLLDRMEAMFLDIRDWLDLPYARPTECEEFIDIEECRRVGDSMRAQLNTEQEAVVVDVLEAVEEGKSKMYFVDGPGGSGKTFVYTCLANTVTALGKKMLCVAWTGIAASLLPSGRTVASVFKIDITSGCRSSSIKPRTMDARRLQAVDIILWDEAPMTPKAAFETVDQVLRDVTGRDSPFGGKVVVLGGDFRQTLPVVDCGGVTDQLANTITRSSLWRLVKTYRLTTNMRLTEGRDSWNEELLAIGDGRTGDGVTGEMEIPSDMLSGGDLIKEVFGEALGKGDINALSKRAILTPLNQHSLEVNEKVLEMIPSEARIYYSLDEVINEEKETVTQYSTEFLNRLTPSGMPPHRLPLKVGAIVMLLRNLDVKEGLCNGQRFVVEHLGDRVLKCRFVSGQRQGQCVLIPKIKLHYQKKLPFVLSRLQFPLRLSFAMTVTKSQGQTFDRIGLLLDTPIFTHGMLYVALSRTRTRTGIKIKAPNNKINNIVYPDALL